MRSPDPPPPSSAQLAAATAQLADRGLQVLRLASGRQFVLVGHAGLYRTLVTGHELLALARAPH